jgi:hypothetical protein
MTLRQLTLEVEERVQRMEGGKTEATHAKNEKRKQGKDQTELVKGEKVRVIRRDKYYGRVGKVIGPRGNKYWDVLLVDGTHEERIYKMRSGLQRLTQD